jgi:hypothetical protein
MLFTLLVLGFAVITGYWSLEQPHLASWTFIAAIGGFGLLMLAQNYLARSSVPSPGAPPLELSSIEHEVVRAHPLFFNAPLTCRAYSSAASAVQIACVVWAVWLLYLGLWIAAVAMVAVFLIAGNAAKTLNPQHFYSYASRREEGAAINAAERAEAVQSVLQRVYVRKKDV